MGVSQGLFGGDLLSRVVPVRVAEGRVLRHHVVAGGLLVHGGGADEDVLRDVPGEGADVA